MGDGMFLLPPAPNKCQVCAVKHSADQPHNAQSMFYQVKHQMEHGRPADWRDAMAHCSDEVRAAWTSELERLGVDVASGAIQPSKAKRP